MENAQTIPQPPGKQGIVRKAPFTQESFSQDRREGGSEGERVRIPESRMEIVGSETPKSLKCDTFPEPAQALNQMVSVI